MTAVLALTALLHAGAAERHDPRDLVLLAPVIAQACEARAPVLPPHGAECVRIVVAIWAVETAHTFSLHPTPRHAFGPLQVLEVPGLTPPGTVMLWSEAGWRAGVRIFRIKFRRAGGRLGLAFRHYNGARYRAAYARRALKVWRRL